MSKQVFLAAYRAHILAEYQWARNDGTKLDSFMSKMDRSIKTDSCPWNWNCDGARKVWREIGCKGNMTLKALRALPETVPMSV